MQGQDNFFSAFHRLLLCSVLFQGVTPKGILVYLTITFLKFLVCLMIKKFGWRAFWRSAVVKGWLLVLLNVGKLFKQPFSIMNEDKVRID